MPVRRRRRHEHTLRFKPDLWGRETESGTVLFDGVVNLAYDEEDSVYYTNAEQNLGFIVGKTIVATIGEHELSGEVRENETEDLEVSLLDGETQGGYIANNTGGYAYIAFVGSYASEGENTLKIVQTD